MGYDNMKKDINVDIWRIYEKEVHSWKDETKFK